MRLLKTARGKCKINIITWLFLPFSINITLNLFNVFFFLRNRQVHKCRRQSRSHNNLNSPEDFSAVQYCRMLKNSSSKNIATAEHICSNLYALGPTIISLTFELMGHSMCFLESVLLFTKEEYLYKKGIYTVNPSNPCLKGHQSCFNGEFKVRHLMCEFQLTVSTKGNCKLHATFICHRFKQSFSHYSASYISHVVTVHKWGEFL